MKINCDKNAIKKAIEVAGGAKDLAKKLDISYQTVRNWLNGNSNPNKANCKSIEVITNGIVRREDIFPDYPWD